MDGDSDGFEATADCNDANAAIRPGAAEIFGNGVDEDCNGRDDVNLDVDGDGFPVPVDCDDANAAIRPGALEIRGNLVDENCDRRVSPWVAVAAAVTNQWALDGSRTRLRSLVVRLAPKGARVTLSCRGRTCPFKSTRRARSPRDLAPVSFSKLFRRARLRSGVRLTLTITAPETIGRIYTYDRQRRAARPADRVPRARRGEGVAVLRALAIALAAARARAGARARRDVHRRRHDDRLQRRGGQDKIAAFETADDVRFTRFGGAALGRRTGCTLPPAGRASSAPRPASRRVILNLDGGDDVAAISPR